MDKGQFKPGVAAIIIIAIGILIFTLLFIFTKRQIMRFAQKFPTDGPHAPIGYEAPKKICQEIERRLNIVKDIKCDPILIQTDNEFSREENTSNYKHIYRMKAMDLVKILEDDIVKACGNDESYRRVSGQDLRVYLLNLRKENLPLSDCESKLINEFVESYTNARNDPIPDFGPEEFHRYMTLFNSLKSSIRFPPKNNTPPNVVQRKTSKNANTFKSFLESPDKPTSLFQTQITQKDENCKTNDHETNV